MIATERLRELLDERGVEWRERVWGGKHSVTTFWHARGVRWHYRENRLGGLRLHADGVTPEQAVAATLGGGECIPHGEWKRISQTQEVRHVFCECGYELGMDERDSFPFECTRLFAMPNYCQECGRKIRKAVKR